MSTSRVLQAYRTLMRAQRTAFAHDTFMQANARQQIRQYFETPLPTKAQAGAAKLEEQLQQAQEATEYLLTNVIQAKKKDNGKFGEYPSAHITAVYHMKRLAAHVVLHPATHDGNFWFPGLASSETVMNIQPRHTVADPPEPAH